MRQHINNNWIASVLLTGLFVCGVVFVATPVMAQDITNNQLKESLEQSITTIHWIVGIITALFVAFLSILITFTFKMNGRLNKLEGVWDMIKNFFDVRLLSNKKPNNKIAGASKIIRTQEDISSVNSPRVLTERGKYLLEVVGAQAYLEDHYDNILEAIKKEYSIELQQLEAHQIKRYTERFLLEKKQYDLTDADFQQILKVLYENAIDYNLLALAMTLNLRDRICRQYKIPVSLEQQQVQK